MQIWYFMGFFGSGFEMLKNIYILGLNIDHEKIC